MCVTDDYMYQLSMQILDHPTKAIKKCCNNNVKASARRHSLLLSVDGVETGELAVSAAGDYIAETVRSRADESHA